MYRDVVRAESRVRTIPVQLVPPPLFPPIEKRHTIPAIEMKKARNCFAFTCSPSSRRPRTSTKTGTKAEMIPASDDDMESSPKA